MRKLLVIIFLFTLLGCSKPDAQDSQGKSINVSDYKNKWLIVNYWADWCEPCLKEMPDLNKLYQSQKEKVIIIGVNFDGMSDDKMNVYAKKLNISFPLTRDFPIENYGVKTIATLPVTFIISPKGKLVAKMDGPQTQESLLKEIARFK